MIYKLIYIFHKFVKYKLIIIIINLLIFIFFDEKQFILLHQIVQNTTFNYYWNRPPIKKDIYVLHKLIHYNVVQLPDQFSALHHYMNKPTMETVELYSCIVLEHGHSRRQNYTRVTLFSRFVFNFSLGVLILFFGQGF